MGVYLVLKQYHDPELGLGRIPRLICRVKGHSWMDDSWVQRLLIDGDTVIVNLPCITCERCLMKILDEEHLDWLKTGFREKEAMNRRVAEMFDRAAREAEALPYEEPPEGLEWLDGMEEEE